VERLWAPWRLEYVQHADEQEGCVFCRAAESDDDEAQLVVHRGERAFVLLNKFPYASGHLLIAPYRHGLNFDDLSDEEALEIHRLGSKGIAALRGVYAPEGFNLGSPAQASPTTAICTSCRAGAATRTSCRCSATCG
jgi:ATP adenylyltransferase